MRKAAAMHHAVAMDEAALAYWLGRQEPCPNCGGTGLPVLLDMQDAESREAVRTGMAALGGCGLGGSSYDHECPRCGERWNSEGN